MPAGMRGEKYFAVPLSFITQVRPMTQAMRRASTALALPDALSVRSG